MCLCVLTCTHKYTCIRRDACIQANQRASACLCVFVLASLCVCVCVCVCVCCGVCDSVWMWVCCAFVSATVAVYGYLHACKFMYLSTRTAREMHVRMRNVIDIMDSSAYMRSSYE